MLIGFIIMESYFITSNYIMKIAVKSLGL